MLKSLVLKKKLEQLRNDLTPINTELEDIQKRESELAKDIETREELTDEEMEAVEEEVDGNEKKKEELVEKKKELEEEIKEIEDELKELEDKSDEVVKSDNHDNEERKQIKKINIRGGANMKMERREQLRQLVQVEENRNFFEDVTNLVLRQSTELKGKELLIPKEVMALINHEVIGYGELIKHVNKINVNGESRIVFNAGTPKLFWTEQCESLKEAVLGEMKSIELDGFKLGGYVFLCKAFVEDAIIDVADYIIKKFAEAIAIALDEAIIKGRGASEKEPEGILTALASDEEKQAKDLVSLLTIVGDLNPRAKNVKLVVNNKTYRSRIMPETYGKDSNGRIVYGLGQTLPDGTQIVISEAMENDKFILGDFKQYVLAERKGMTFDTSDQVRWIEEEIGYKTSGRYDGKVTDKTYFIKGALGE